VKRLTTMSAALLVLAALAIAGCGGGGEGEAGGGSTVGSTEISGLGDVLVDSSGMTVYLFTPDKGTTSTCYGECEEEWPPVVAAGKPSAGEGATSADLGTTKRKDGTVQVTYKGHPLYTFADDKGPGEANGQEDDGVWFALDEAGSAVKGKGTEAKAGADEDGDGDGDGDTSTGEEGSSGAGY
jgi:predicted lipoprotein with Yx(FWY)xxD motif